MKITINATHDVKGFNIVRDENYNFWQLPFIDKAGRQIQVKQIKPCYPKNYPAYRIKNRYLSEKILNQLCTPNKRVLVFDFIQPKPRKKKLK